MNRRPEPIEMRRGATRPSTILTITDDDDQPVSYAGWTITGVIGIPGVSRAGTITGTITGLDGSTGSIQIDWAADDLLIPADAYALELTSTNGADVRIDTVELTILATVP